MRDGHRMSCTTEADNLVETSRVGLHRQRAHIDGHAFQWLVVRRGIDHVSRQRRVRITGQEINSRLACSEQPDATACRLELMTGERWGHRVAASVEGGKRVGATGF